MESLTDIWRLDAVGQAELIRKGEISAAELLQATIARAERIDQSINAICEPTFEYAKAANPPADAPFAGVPTLLKNLIIEQTGLPYTIGNKALKDCGHRSQRDTDLGARIREIGMVTLGRSNAPEFGAQTTTQPLAYGATRNPWNLEYSVSGSSGGAAAAVAAGIVSAAQASDGGGSIRLPAAWTGLVGLKPSRGTISIADDIVSLPAVEFFITRSVRDARALLRAVKGSPLGSLFECPPSILPPQTLRVGVMENLDVQPTHPACKKAMREAADMIANLGHMVFPVIVPTLSEIAWLADAKLSTLNDVSARIEGVSKILGRQIGPTDVEPYLAQFMVDQELSAVDLLVAFENLQSYSLRLTDEWHSFDILLTPTCTEPPQPLAQMDASRVGSDAVFSKVLAHCTYTQPFNISGQPAISVPVGWTDDGLPVGVQLVGRLGSEEILLDLAQQLEGPAGWLDRWPTIAEGGSK